MEQRPLETYELQIDFGGLIRLLAEHLYSEPDVFVRELIQNAHDAIEMRAVHQQDLAGRIEIEADEEARTITFSDNGVGMDREDIRRFLSTIGGSGKGSLLNELKTRDKESALQLIGQFGIGLLSAFVVAEEVEVTTRRWDSDTTYVWRNGGSLACEVYLGRRDTPGTDVVVKLRADCAYFTSPDIVLSIIRKYCEFLGHGIYLQGRGPVNEPDAPFYRKHWNSTKERDLACRVFVERQYPNDIHLDVITVDIERPVRAQGVLFIAGKNMRGFQSGQLDLFVRRMLIRKGDSSLLPEWAKFVSGLIDSPDLSATAARDNVKRDTAFEALRRALADIVIARLIELSSNDPDRFQQINRWHHYNLKGIAAQDDHFFQAVGGLLLFDTNQGTMSLEDYSTKNAARVDLGNRVPIYYFSYHGGSSQFYTLANARNWCVIDAGGQFDEQFLERYAETHHLTRALVRLDESDDPALFGRPTTERQTEFKRVESRLADLLHRHGVGNVVVRLREFEPSTIPAVVVEAKQTAEQKQVREYIELGRLTGVFRDITDEALKNADPPLVLNLNSSCPFVQRLASRLSKDDEVVDDVLMALYNSAILYSHSHLTRRNTQVIHDQIGRLCESVLDLTDRNKAVFSELETLRAGAMERTREEPTRPAHVVIFMITPYDSNYAVLEEAVRRVFERAPYFFEVRLARDFVKSAGLLANIRVHIAEAHAFIAEISDLNPNVMFELGAVALVEDGRPVFAMRSREASAAVPSDIKERLFISYSSLQSSVQDLELELRAAIERDGRPSHEGVTALLRQRTKRHLSRAVLEGLAIKLSDDRTRELLRHYHSVEQLLEDSAARVSERTGVRPALVAALLDEIASLAVES